MPFPQVVTGPNDDATLSKGYISQNSFSVDMPSSVSADQAILIIVAAGNEVDEDLNTPTGFTQSFQESRYSRRLAVFTKQAVGNEGGTTVTVDWPTSATARSGVSQVFIFSDWNSIEAVTGTSAASDANPDPPSFSPGFASGGAVDALWFGFGFAVDDDETWDAAPTDYSGLVSTVSGVGDPGGISMGSARRELNAQTEDPGAFTISGADAWAAATLAVEPGSLGSGSTTTTLEFNQGSYTLTGQDIGLVQTEVFPFEQGDYAVTGQDIGLVQVKVLQFEQGSFTITDSEVDAITTDILDFEQGSFTVTGNDIDLILTQIMEFGQGAYVITGNDIILNIVSQTVMSFESGNYSVTGNDIDFSQRDILAFEQGSYTVNGQDINLVERRVFQFEQGEYVITGYDIGFSIEDSPEILILVSEITTDLELDSEI